MTIKTSRQLKDKLRSLSGGDFIKSQMLLRKYLMERFLARISVSEYKNNFILKGGMLVSAVLGEDARSTMDIDTTIQHLPINADDAKVILINIMGIELDDGIHYEIVRIEDIMEEHDYSGLRITLKAHFDGIKETIKIDISTGDEITPFAIEFSYNMMFDQGNISILSYNLETLLAEKLETILARNTTNTRMRDFYDIHILWKEKGSEIDHYTLKDAYINTSQKRDTLYLLDDAETLMDEISISKYMQNQWINYRNKNSYVGDLTWDDVTQTVEEIMLNYIIVQKQDNSWDLSLI